MDVMSVRIEYQCYKRVEALMKTTGSRQERLGEHLHVYKCPHFTRFRHIYWRFGQNGVTKKNLQPIFEGPVPRSVAGGRLLRCLRGRRLLFAPLLGAVAEASVQEAVGGLMLEVLPGAHQGRVVDQGVEEMPVPAGPLGTGHSELFLLLLDQLDP